MIPAADTAASAAGVIAIGPWQLALAAGFVVLTGIVSLVLRLGVGRRFVFAAARACAQLLALGLVLGWVFRLSSPWLVGGILLLMLSVAALTVARRAPDAPGGVLPVAFFALGAVGVFVTFTVTGAVIGVEPWYLPRYVIPIAGMILGNSMNDMAVALERAFADLDARADEVLALTALGATPWEAARPSIRAAMRAGMIPGINTLTTAGIVFIPGMMAGQILAGTDPMRAAPYQIVVMFMISAAGVLGSALAVSLAYRRRFTADGVFLEKGMR